jgi:hypothetical protein
MIFLVVRLMYSMLSSIFFGRQGMRPKAPEALQIHLGVFSSHALFCSSWLHDLILSCQTFVIGAARSTSVASFYSWCLLCCSCSTVWGTWYILLIRKKQTGTWNYFYLDFGSPLHILNEEVPKIVKSLNKQLREKSLKTKVNLSSLLQSLPILLMSLF